MQYRNIALLSLCQAVMMTGTSLLIATSALVGRSLVDDPSLATVPLGLQFLAMTLATIPASLLMKQFGRQAGFMCGVLLGLCGALLAAFAVVTDNFLMFCIAAMLFGAFNGSGQFYRFAAADVAKEGRKAQAISLVLAGGIAAGFMGPNLASWTRTLLNMEFAASYLALGIMYLLGILAIAMLRIPLPSSHERNSSGRPLWHIARQPRFAVAVLTAAVAYGAMNVLMVATPLSMQAHQHAFSDTAFVIQWHILAMFVPSFFTGNLIRRYGLFPVMAAGVVFMIICTLVNWGGTSVWNYWTSLLFLGVGWNFMFIGGTTLLTETYAESEKAKSQACNDFIVFGTVTLTAMSSGALLHGLGWTVLNLSVLPFLILVLAGLGWVGLRGGDKGRPSEELATSSVANNT